MALATRSCIPSCSFCVCINLMLLLLPLLLLSLLPQWLKLRLTQEGFGYRFISGSMPLKQRA